MFSFNQIPICDQAKPYTAFEVGERLWEFNRIPFGVTNGGLVFQRKMDDIVDEDNLEDPYPYFDNVTTGGYDKAHLTRNCVI